MMKIIKNGVHRISSRLASCRHAIVTAPMAVFAATEARAQSQGVSGLFTNLGTTVTNFIQLVSIASVAVGVAAVLYGLVMMIKKGTGRGDDIEWRQIMWPMVGGAFATVLMFIVYSLVAEVGAPQNQMGQGWGG